MNSYLVIASAFVLLSLVLLGYGFLVIRRVLRRFVRLVISDSSVMGDDARARLIGLALAILVFPSTLGRFIGAVITLGLSLFTQVPLALNLGWKQAKEIACTVSAPSDCLADGWFTLLRAIGDGTKGALNEAQVATLPYGRFVLFLGAWAIFASLLRSMLAHDGPPHASGFRRLERWIGSIPRITKQNLLFFLILTIGLYLSIAAITAIPNLRQDGSAAADTATTPAKLAEHLRGSAHDFPEPQLRDPLLNLKTLLDATPPRQRPAGGLTAGTGPTPPPPSAPQGAVVPDTTAPRVDSATAATTSTAAAVETAGRAAAAPLTATIPDSVPQGELDFVRRYVDFLDSKRAEMVRAHLDLLHNARTRQDGAISDATTSYSLTNENRLGDREKREHYLLITEWFSRLSRNLQQNADGSAARVSKFERVLSAWGEEERRDLLAGSTDMERFVTRASDAEAQAIALSQPFEGNFLVDPMPSRPQLGSAQGPFSFINRWLLRTESLPLALITGMLGFGLLGAAASTFVREQKRRVRKPVQPLVQDLPGVVIRGGSAAVVVFLAVMGGLAVFSARDSEPNPYVLLFTCLVGAVFSERVWIWAEKNLGRTFGGEDGGDGQGEASRDGEPRRRMTGVPLPRRKRRGGDSPPDDESPPDSSPPLDEDHAPNDEPGDA